jgi:tetratricopeptide (TPR) repeat protein/transcriptional regulator with XRE-family HTH domain
MGGARDAAGARLGGVVRERRRAAGLTQRQLAQRSGLSVAAVRDLEQGRSKRPRPGSLDALARALGLDAWQLAALAAARDKTRPAARGAPVGHGDAPAGHDSGLWLAVLGPLTAWRDGLPVGLGPPGQAAVAGLLAVQPGELVRRETVIDVLWGQRPPATAAELVQAHVSRLRRALDPGGRSGLVEQGPAGYRLCTGAGELDAAAFAELAGRAGAAAPGDAAAACELYAQALGLWRGEPAANIQVLAGHPAVTGLARRRAEAVLGYADAACRVGWHQRVLPLLEELARQQPLEERVHARLIVALAGAGQQAAAIEAFEALRRRLDEDLGVRPGPELTAAHQRVLRQDIPPPADGTAAVTGRPGPDAGQASALGMACSLPPDTAAFTGRRAELDRITAAVAQAAGSGGVVAICAIGGMPGVGKTALAVHASHLLAGRFPDRQLFVSLHAHTPGQAPLTPHAALAGLLAAVGVDARYLPGDLAGRAALWRDRMAGQKILLVLDNAASTAQVAPLLPASAGCLVLVTSRRHLGDLPGAAVPVQLPVLTADEAREMFVQLAPRAADGPDGAVAELAELAGFLPLAVSLLARVYARHPSWTLADLAAETRAGLLTLTAEHDSIAAAFELSYRHLAPGQQQFFRRLGVHPGTSTDAYAAAALADISLREAAGHLDALHGEGLLTETGHRRYGMHDLIRSYVRDLAATDQASSREQALDRLLDYYQHTAALADKLLARHARTRPAPAPQAIPAAVPDLTGRTQALAWARAERATLLACLDQATAAGQHARVIALTAATASLLRLDGPWTSTITRHAAAIQAARHLGDRLAQANALNDLGDVRLLTGDHRGAAETLEEALDIYRDIGSRGGQANALTDLGSARRVTGDYRGAAKALKKALGIYRDIGNRLGQASSLNYLGDVRQLTGDYRGAAEALEEALGIYRDISHRGGQGNALTSLGIVLQVTGDYRGAAKALEEALGIYRDISHRLGQANALNSLGNVRQLTGDYRGAAKAQEEALDIYRDTGSRGGQANALTSLGIVRRVTGDYRGAAKALEEALAISRDISYRHGEAEILNETAALYRVRGDPTRAAEYHRQALTLSREIASPRDEACALAGLGRCALALGRTSDAAENLRQARDIFQRIGAPEAADAAAELDTLAGPRQGSPGLEQGTS